MTTPSFGVSRTFDTTLERLWTAFTDAGDLAAWCPPDGARLLHSDMVLAVGGRHRFCLDMPKRGPVRGVWDLRRVEPPTLLTFVQSFVDEDEAPVRNPFDLEWPTSLRVEIRFALQGGGATVTINLAPVEPAESEIAAFRKSFAALSRCWESALDILDAHLAAN